VGTVYAVVTLSDSTPVVPHRSITTIDGGQAKPDGTLEFVSDRPKLEFFNNLDALKSNGGTVKKAVLIRFTGRIHLGDKGYVLELPHPRIVESIR